MGIQEKISSLAHACAIATVLPVLARHRSAQTEVLP